MDRRNELEQLRRSLAMAQPRSMALTREDAMSLVAELAAAQATLDHVRAELRRLVDETAR